MAIWLSVMQIWCLCVLARQEGQQMFAHRFTVVLVPSEPLTANSARLILKYKLKRNCAGKSDLSILLPNQRAHLFQPGSYWFLLVAYVEGKNKCDAQCSFTGFLISVPHEGVFMLTTSDSTSWHYCTPHQGIPSEGPTKAHSNPTMSPT